jgi:hypothetical protein
MRKAFARVTAVLVIVPYLFASMPKTASEQLIKQSPADGPAYLSISMPPPDPRVAELDSFFQKHKCPYKSTDVYLQAADKYKIDFRLLPALSVIEESCGLHNPSNNLFGYYQTIKTKTGGLSIIRPFKTIDAGVDFVASEIANNHYYKNKTLKQQLSAYNSVNPSYYSEVLKLMLEISK